MTVAQRGGAAWVFDVPDPLKGGGEDGPGDGVIRAPMPGLVRKLAVAAGDTVAEGADLVVLEAMKMEHTLRAPAGGVIAEVACEEGAQVTGGAVLVRLEADDG